VKSKSGIFETKPAISLKRRGLEPKLLQSVYELVYGLSTGDKSGDHIRSVTSKLRRV